MSTIAIVDDVLPLQLRERPGELDPVRVVWTGTDRDQLREAGTALDIERLGDDPIAEARQLAETCSAEML